MRIKPSCTRYFMSIATYVPLIPLLSLLTISCTSEITDTEDRVFDIKCKKGKCILTLKRNSAGAPGTINSKSPHASYVTEKSGRILKVCRHPKNTFECRALHCASSSTCSQLGGAEFACEKKLCQAPQRALTAKDKVALCLAGSGKWQRTPRQLELFTLSQACTPPCELPGACMSP